MEIGDKVIIIDENNRMRGRQAIITGHDDQKTFFSVQFKTRMEMLLDKGDIKKIS